ncbi:MAG TPA: hydantoinase B/oxoprolinase family protein [Steroidobacteraceae bacterium]|nr:hydantoinase B/oxoprolinase family protein [Steroidobacteraceae bacterium]
MSRGWRFSIDRGGTFTDVVGIAPDGRLHVRKVLSAASGRPRDPGLDAVRAILEEHARSAAIDSVRVGTTVATNALLERTGDPVLLVTTAGFADALEIGDQSRPDLFALQIVRPAPLHTAVIEASERLDASGEVLIPLDREALRGSLSAARALGLRAVAIVFLHAWRQPRHEREAAALAREIGFEEVSVSHELSPLVRYGARGGTTVLDAYLASGVRRYVESLESGLAELDSHARLELMQSHGGLAAPPRFHPSSSLLSGPAGGLIGARAAATRLGITRLVTFDMGGTSTDVALIDGELPRRHEHSIAGLTIQESMLDVHTIAAGGGSILVFADGRASVGPASAGADPGPACYGRGGPLTLTDVQVLLGRLRPDTLPKLFGPDGTRAIDCAVIEQRFRALAADAQAAAPADSRAAPGAGPEHLAKSYLTVAIAAMANAIRRVSGREGLDPAELTLFAFGGAAGQHACGVARAAGMRRILTHPLASVLSAYGIAIADRSTLLRASLRQRLDHAGLAAAVERLSALEARARIEMADAGALESDVAAESAIVRQLELRAGDSETPLAVPLDSLAAVEREFRATFRRRFGFDPTGLEVLIEAVGLEMRAFGLEARELQAPEEDASTALPRTGRVWFDGWREVPILASAGLRTAIAGPALIVAPHSTLVVEPGWTARPMANGEILLEFEEAVRREVAGGAEPVAQARASLAPPMGALIEPSRIEIFNNLFMHVAEQMGEVLRQTAQSTNIKERLDYSCAVFDAAGGLVANAPHMPVHLGSMGASVRAVLAAHGGRMRRGDAWLLNSPYHGGTHLPDMTVVTPVFAGHDAEASSATAAPDFFVASRAHHADIGGAAPGSMPAFSRRIEEEGALFEDFQLVERGRLRAAELEAHLLAPAYPARNPRQNLADLRAQLAANARGVIELERALREHGLEALHVGMHAVQENAAECVRRAIERLRPGEFRCEMDGGQVIAVRIDIDRTLGRARIDFSGTSPQGAHNFNAPRAVSIAAVLYVFRTLVDRPIPLNEGCIAPLDIVIPPGSMLDPLPPAAVAAGNVETSQCIVDALYGALGALAASQGTMNNLTFGDERLQYYETIAGGSGAGPDFDGASAVQTHMTNSRLTDPETLEARFPVLVREFRIRRGSGGPGRHRGGDGAVRRLEFRARLAGALLANRRRVPPFGLAGGRDGAAGAARLIRASGEVETLPATASFRLEPGDQLEILTPGGGGWGREQR